MVKGCHNKACQQPDPGGKNQVNGYTSDAKEWFCSFACYVEQIADETIERKKKSTHQTIWKMQIGLLLLKRNLIDQSKLNQALLEKNRSGRRIGEILVDSGHISEADLKKALSIQAGVAPITLDLLTPVHLTDTIPARFYTFFGMTVFNVSSDEMIMSVAVSDVQNLSYLNYFFDRTYSEYLIKYYLDGSERIQANLNHNFSDLSFRTLLEKSSDLSLMEQTADPLVLNFLQFLTGLGAKNTKVDHLDQSLWVRSELDEHKVDIYLTPKGK